MAKDDILYPLQPSDDGSSQEKPAYSPWADYADSGKQSDEETASTDDADDYTFTEDGLKDGISVGEAKRYSPIDPKYRGEQQEGTSSNSFETPWSKYAQGKPQTDTASPQTDKDAKTNPYTNPNEQFHGKTLGDVEDFLKGRLEYYKSLEESDEDRAKREKNEKRLRSLAAVGDILGSFHKAYSYQRGVQPMNIPSVSQKAQERIDKAKAERDKNADRVLNYAIALDKLNSSKATAGYQQRMLEIRQQQQDRLTQHEETQRTIADARVKYYEAQSNKNDEQAAYWKTKADLLERGWPQEQAEQAARIEERRARAAKYTHDANAPYKTGGSSSSGSRSSGSSSGAGTEKVTEKTDARGRTTTTRTYTQPRQRSTTPKKTTAATPKKPQGSTQNKGKFSSFSIH